VIKAKKKTYYARNKMIAELMKTCKGCKYANWQKTIVRRLHPSGDGRCMYPYELPPLPAAYYWLNGPPGPYGGSINRRIKLKNHCPYWVSGNCL
jgi:hypothetical protein